MRSSPAAAQDPPESAAERPADAAWLVELTGPHRGRVHPLGVGEQILGRDSEVAIRIEHRDVSREHVRLVVDRQGVVLHDLGSKNGVCVQGARLDAPRRLVHGETFMLGELVLQLTHPASHVDTALSAAGETTATYHRPQAQPVTTERSLALPLVGVAVFGVLMLIMLLR